MKRIIIMLIIVVSGYGYISDKVVDSGVNIIDNHKVQLEMVIDSMD